MEDPQTPSDAQGATDVEEPSQDASPTPQEAPPEPADTEDGPQGGIVAEPASVFEELGEMQAEARKDDTKILELLPGRFRGRLAVRVKRIDPKKRKKKVRKLAKRGVTDEAELQYAAEVIAEATEAILYRPQDSDRLVEAQTLSADLGDTPVRWDQRLGKMLRMDFLTGSESEATIVRLVFKNVEALEAFFQDLELWLREALPADDDDDDDDEAVTENPS